jgi:arylsulfatase A-like enzyme
MRAPVLSLLLLLLAPATQAQNPAPPPNIVILLADDLGYADLSLHGSSQIKTPHLDGLARAGVRCTQAYAADSICGPSRAGLLTGRYPQRFGFESNVYKNRAGAQRARYRGQGLPLDERTLAELLLAADYDTALVGKWHLGWSERFHPDQHGFEHFYGFLAGSRAYFPRPGAPPDEHLLAGREPVDETFEYLTDELARDAARFIDGHAESPFLLVLSFSAVHGPMQAPEERLASHAGIEPVRRRKLVAMTEAMDDAVGTVLAALEHNHLTARTLVVFTSDHGGSSKNAADNSPLRGGKGDFLEGGLRVPLFLKWPERIRAGSTFDAPVSLLDLVPTALAAAEVVPARTIDWDGVNLLPHLSGAAATPPHQTLFWRRLGQAAIRDGSWKLILGEDGTNPALYDLSTDPNEAANLAASHPERVKALTGQHAAWSATLRTPLWRKYKDGDEGD